MAIVVPKVTGIVYTSALNTITLTVNYAGFLSEVNITPSDIVSFGSDGQGQVCFIYLADGNKYNSILCTDITTAVYANNAALYAALKGFYTSMMSASPGKYKAGTCTVIMLAGVSTQALITAAVNTALGGIPNNFVVAFSIFRNTTSGNYEAYILYST